MPIYAYRCASCGHTKDALQKISDAPLTVCPACGASAFAKQVTAAGFQLKGSGWYATDFKGNGTKKPADGAKTDDAKTEGAKTDGAKTEAGKTDAGKTEPAKTEASKSGDSSAPAKSGDGGTSGSSSAAESSGPKATKDGGASARH